MSHSDGNERSTSMKCTTKLVHPIVVAVRQEHSAKFQVAHIRGFFDFPKITGTVGINQK
jgi:hypothetical protein